MECSSLALKSHLWLHYGSFTADKNMKIDKMRKIISVFEKEYNTRYMKLLKIILSKINRIYMKMSIDIMLFLHHNYPFWLSMTLIVYFYISDGVLYNVNWNPNPVWDKINPYFNTIMQNNLQFNLYLGKYS